MSTRTTRNPARVESQLIRWSARTERAIAMYMNSGMSRQSAVALALELLAPPKRGGWRNRGGNESPTGNRVAPLAVPTSPIRRGVLNRRAG